MNHEEEKLRTFHTKHVNMLWQKKEKSDRLEEEWASERKWLRVRLKAKNSNFGEANRNRTFKVRTSRNPFSCFRLR